MVLLADRYPMFRGDVRSQVFALICDVTFVYVTELGGEGGFDNNLDCTLDALGDNITMMMRAQHEETSASA
ncbi:hypothetical protein [Actinocorallia lasiicapitis]